MAIHTVKLYQEFDAPTEQVWNDFSDHNNLGSILGQSIKRIVDSLEPGDVNGVGSVRLISVPLMPFEETVRKSEKGRLIVYQITKGTPLDYHLGTMVFADLPAGRSSLDYTIDVSSKVPLLGNLVKTALQNGIGGSLKKYANSLKK